MPLKQVRAAPLRARLLALAGVLFLALDAASFIQAQEGTGRRVHGLSLDGGLRYPAGFTHRHYANPQAPQGGGLSLSAFGAFDTLNPFTLKGRPAGFLTSLVFEPLMEGSLDEVFSMYGRLAKEVSLDPDGLGIKFYLHPKAAFSDGMPVQAEDVVFSFEALTSEAAAPLFRYYYQDIASVTALDAKTVQMRFKRKNRELASIAGQLYVLPRHVYAQGSFGRDFLKKAVGSGPYTVERYDFGRNVVFQRHQGYWGNGEGFARGRYNFSQVALRYYRDNTVRFEAFQAGEFDVFPINSSKQWALDTRGRKWDRHWLVKQTFPHGNAAGMQGFVFNTRQKIFQSRQVRKALAVVFDFPWSNKTLFHSSYAENNSFFANSELAASGLPGPLELALLEPLRADLPPEVFSQPMEALGLQFKDLRSRLREAARILREDGWVMKDGVLQKDGENLEFTFLLQNPSFERVVEPYLKNLARLGVRARLETVDDALFEERVRTRRFSMMVGLFPQSLSPGNEQREFWHSATAFSEGSQNTAGVRNKAIDALVEHVIKAENRQELIVATKALDRALWFGYHVVPGWYLASYRVAYWNRFSFPKTLPGHYVPRQFFFFWWQDSARAARLKQAMAEDAEKVLPVQEIEGKEKGR